MNNHKVIQMKIPGACLSVALVASAMSAGARTGDETWLQTGTEQQEADLRVIAARCGTPAFERSFHRQSTVIVSAGIIAGSRRPADVEKTITALRRSPIVLVAASSDCPAMLAQLALLQRSRAALLKGSREPGRSGR